jgi:hypothetical protein
LNIEIIYNSTNEFGMDIYSKEYHSAIGHKIRLNEYITRYWSYIMTIEINKNKFYVKIPKNDAISKDICTDIVNKDNHRMALDEYNALLELNKFYNTNSTINIVELIGFDEKFNAIITREFEGKPLHVLCRYKNSDITKDYITIVGEWLKSFHTNIPVMELNKNEILNHERHLLENTLDFLIKNCNNSNYIIGLKNTILKKFDNEVDVLYPSFNFTLRGFEIRNFLVDCNDSLCFLDPTEMVVNCYLDDVARFIVSVDMLFWGTIDAIYKPYNNEYKETFINAYFGRNAKMNSALSFHIVKWLLIRWKETYYILNRGRISKFAKPIITKYYVDYLFKKWINTNSELMQ